MKGVLTPGSYARLWLTWLGLAAGVSFLCLLTGQGDFGGQWVRFGWPTGDVFGARWPRVLAAGVVGFALAGAGVTLQALLRNPLADPYVLGISSGSAVGVMSWIMITSRAFPGLFLQMPEWLLATGRSVPAVGGALVTCMIVFVLARVTARQSAHGIEPVTLLLVGVVVSAMNAALLMVLNSMVRYGLRADLATYLLGSISENDLTPQLLAVAGAVVMVGYLPVLLAAPALNIGSLSDVEATSLGINVRVLRTISFVCASVMTAAALLLSGPIGFVGLICPHICRRLIGADHRKLVVAAPLCGAAFLMAADTAVRTMIVMNRGQLPVGVVTALCGGPFFLWLLRRGRGFGGGGLM